MKSNSNFKLPKQTKMLLSSILDPHLRGLMKRDYIKAILENQVTRSKGNKKVSKRDIED